MVVLRVPIVQFVDGTPVKLKTLQQTSIHELTKRSVHCGGTDIVFLSTSRKTIDEFVRVKMIVFLKNCVDQELSLIRLTQASGLQVFLEPLLWRERDAKRFKRFRGIRHSIGAQRDNIGTSDTANVRRKISWNVIDVFLF